MNISKPSARANVLGVALDAVNMPLAVEAVLAAARNNANAYICLAAVHSIVEAHRNPALARALDEAALVLPDGMPTVWIGKSQGFTEMDRVFGPDLMLRVLDKSQASGERHFLLGGKPGVAEQLRQVLKTRFPKARIVGSYSPPFRKMTADEQRSLCNRLEVLRPDIVWVGLGAPKQEQFMHEFCGRLNTRVMIGVGAAFDFHTGRLKDSPRWVKRAGLQWFHRLLQEPRRLCWRYLRTNTLFLVFALLSFLRLKTFPLPSSATVVPAAAERSFGD